MLAKPPIRLAAGKAGFGNMIRVFDMLRCLFKMLFAGKQIKPPSREVRNAIRDKEETEREICEMIRWNIFNR